MHSNSRLALFLERKLIKDFVKERRQAVVGRYSSANHENIAQKADNPKGNNASIDPFPKSSQAVCFVNPP